MTLRTWLDMLLDAFKRMCGCAHPAEAGNNILVQLCLSQEESYEVFERVRGAAEESCIALALARLHGTNIWPGA